MELLAPFGLFCALIDFQAERSHGLPCLTDETVSGGRLSGWEARDLSRVAQLSGGRSWTRGLASGPALVILNDSRGQGSVVAASFPSSCCGYGSDPRGSL